MQAGLSTSRVIDTWGNIEKRSWAVDVLVFIGLLVLTGVVCWWLGRGWDYLTWVRDGRPQLSQSEELQCSKLVYDGTHPTVARREVVRQRNAGFRQTIDTFRDISDMLHNPDRAQEAAEMLPTMTEAILARSNDDPVNQQLVETFLEQSGHEKAHLFLEAMKDPEQRTAVTGLFTEVVGLGKRANDKTT